MKKILIFVLLISITGLFALEIGKVELPNNLEIGGKELILNGAGLRKKVIIKVYACALYVAEKVNNSEEIFDANDEIAILMHFIYKKVGNEKLISAWNEGFQLAGVSEKMKNEIALFNSYFSEPAMKNDVYLISYTPETGVSVEINGKLKGSIPGKEFRKAVFSIWLGNDSALPKLKQALLDK